jgi:hypothetical protein
MNDKVQQLFMNDFACFFFTKTIIVSFELNCFHIPQAIARTTTIKRRHGVNWPIASCATCSTDDRLSAIMCLQFVTNKIWLLSGQSLFSTSFPYIFVWVRRDFFLLSHTTRRGKKPKSHTRDEREKETKRTGGRNVPLLFRILRKSNFYFRLTNNTPLETRTIMISIYYALHDD